MPMTQNDIRAHYETNWAAAAQSAARSAAQSSAPAALAYSNPVEDAVLYPIYQQLLADHHARINGGKMLDVGVGSGRWLRFFCERFTPREFVGIDFTRASIDLLSQCRPDPAPGRTRVRLECADITDPHLPLLATDAGSFDFINIANVLFHIPEQGKFAAALGNLKLLLAPGGQIVTTEYLPRQTMRTDWMLVRSRDEFSAAATAAGLTIADVRPTGFFNNDPCGISGGNETREPLNRVRAMQKAILEAKMSETTAAFIKSMFAAIEVATLAWAKGLVEPADMPSQKLVLLRH